MYGGGPAIVQDMYFPVVGLSNRKIEVPLAGITNPLYLCFMISVVQALTSNQHFAYYFLKKYHSIYVGFMMMARKRCYVIVQFIELSKICGIVVSQKSTLNSFLLCFRTNSAHQSNMMLINFSFNYATCCKKKSTVRLQLKHLKEKILKWHIQIISS